MTASSPTHFLVLSLLVIHTTIAAAARNDSPTSTAHRRTQSALTNSTQLADLYNKTSSSVAAAADKTLQVDLALAIAIGALVIGAILCVAGYHLYRPVVFIGGFVGGGIGVMRLVTSVAKDKSWDVHATSWIGFFFGGLVIALVLCVMSACVTGATSGVLLAITIHVTLAHKIYPRDPMIVLVALCLILGINFAILAHGLGRPMLIVATSYIGANAIAWGVGHFAGVSPRVSDLHLYTTTPTATTASAKALDSSVWICFLVGILVLFALGAMAQFCITATRDTSSYYCREKKNKSQSWLCGHRRKNKPYKSRSSSWCSGLGLRWRRNRQESHEHEKPQRTLFGKPEPAHSNFQTLHACTDPNCGKPVYHV